MSNQDDQLKDLETTEKKKVSLQEAMQQMLENKKQGNKGGKAGGPITNTTRQSQATKKVSNQRRKMGSS